MADNSNPSLGKDPADSGSFSGMLRFVFHKMLQNVDGMLPCVVTAVDSERNYATVRPQIMIRATDGSLTRRATIAKVPILHLGGGDYVLTFPIKEGDAGWIIANDRDISLYLQAEDAAGPNTNRLHSFEDGLFIPDAARKFTLDSDDEDRVVLQSLDGSARIALGVDKIVITHPTLVRVECPRLEVSGDVFAGPDEISLKTHLHSGVTVGGGNTGVPVP